MGTYNAKNYREQGQLTVEELIKLLEKQPKNALVWHEGCDCNGAADGVEYEEADSSVYITRCN